MREVTTEDTPLKWDVFVTRHSHGLVAVGRGERPESDSNFPRQHTDWSVWYYK
jgi:hypothetical protein